MPTDISPIVIRLPHLLFYEGVASGLRADVKQTASARGHRMTTYSAGDSHCIDCDMAVSVYHTHPFQRLVKGLAYRGTALDSDCPGAPDDDPILQRVPPDMRLTRKIREANQP